MKTLIDRIYKVNNSRSGFHNDTENLSFILRKDLFSVHVIERSSIAISYRGQSCPACVT